jgi:phospholipid/cholesterol/gamma-HCH transport system substrate-binding protein
MVLGLAGFGLVEVSKRQWGWQPTFLVRTSFQSIGGVAEGDRVRLQGIDAGVVEGILPPEEIDRRKVTIVRGEELKLSIRP